MVDECRLRIVRTKDNREHEPFEELLSLDLPGSDWDGSGDFYKETVINILAGHKIYAWRVTDQRVLINVGASAEFQDLIVFLAGAGAAAFTGEIVKRVVSVLEASSKKMLGRATEISDVEALAQATIRRRQSREFGQLLEMKRTEAGNRIFRFSDGSEFEIDKHGGVVREEHEANRDSHQD